MVLPDIDGIQLIASIRGDTASADVPIIVLTATSMAEDALSRLGSQIFIHRPGGLKLTEVLRCLPVVIKSLLPDGSA